MTFQMTPYLRDYGDWVEVGVMRFWDGKPYQSENDLGLYVYYRSKEKCEQAVKEAGKFVDELLGEIKKENSETHPNLDKYR